MARKPAGARASTTAKGSKPKTTKKPAVKAANKPASLVAQALAIMGRPTDYRPEYAAQAESLCRLGATDYELAQHFQVDTATIHRWRNTREDFCESVKVGKEHANERVERSLFNRAVGYSYESEKIFNFKGLVIRAPYIEHVPPDPGAAMNWLKNRRPAQWREKTEVDLTNSDGSLSLDPSKLSTQALKEILAARSPNGGSDSQSG